MFGTETILCLSLLLIGSVGLLVMFVLTDNDAVRDSIRRMRGQRASDVETPQREA